MRAAGLGRYFTFWALGYIAACSVLGLGRRFDPAAVALFLFFGNLALLAVSALVWRRRFDASFFVASAALHGVGLAAFPWWRRRPRDSLRFARARFARARFARARFARARFAWAAPLRNLSLLWFAYLAAVGGPAAVLGVYRRMPTRWSDLFDR